MTVLKEPPWGPDFFYETPAQARVVHLSLKIFVGVIFGGGCTPLYSKAQINSFMACPHEDDYVTSQIKLYQHTSVR